MFDFLELVATSCQERVRLRATLDGPGFATARPISNLVGGQNSKHLLQQLLPLALGTRLQECLAISPRSGEAAGKAHPFQNHVIAASRFQHESAHQVMD